MMCLSEGTVTTRKPHICEACETAISVGERAIRYSGICHDSNTVGSVYYHKECRRAEVGANCAAGTDDDEWFPLHYDFDESEGETIDSYPPIVAFRLFARATKIELNNDRFWAEKRTEMAGAVAP